MRSNLALPTKSDDIELPDETPPPTFLPVLGFSPNLRRVWWEGRAFDQCWACGLAMCEDAGDYVTEVEALSDGVSPACDPHWIVLCEDCEMAWLFMGCTDDDDLWEWEERHAVHT